MGIFKNVTRKNLKRNERLRRKELSTFMIFKTEIIHVYEKIFSIILNNNEKHLIKIPSN